MVTLVLAALVLGAAATASARPKKPSVVDPSSSATTVCYGTPIIMQGMDCPEHAARWRGPRRGREGVERPHVIARGSGGSYTASLPRTPLLTSPTPTAPYIPPPVSNPSERIIQLNQSFPLYGGIGNNPADRDSYLRYHLTR
jgi:hypothetical protein